MIYVHCTHISHEHINLKVSRMAAYESVKQAVLPKESLDMLKNFESNTNFYNEAVLNASHFSIPLSSCISSTCQPTTTETTYSAPFSWQPPSNGNILATQEPVLTPTNVQGTFLDMGLLAVTPEFVHPRDGNVPQWLMSPPVSDENAGNVSSAPMCAGFEFTSPLFKKLLTPDDFVPSSLPAPSYIQITKKEELKLPTAFKALSTGLSCPFSEHVCPVTADCNTIQLLEKMFHLAKKCDNFTKYYHEIGHILPQYTCCTLFAIMFHSTLSRCMLHKAYCCLLQLPVSNKNPSAHVTEESFPKLFPIGVFWDIENCQVPNGKSALAIVQKIRMEFFNDHVEAEFMAVCDINKESKRVIQDLNNAQVNVIHVNATAKNAADDKLRQSIRRYAQNHHAPATVILITGDCNFTSEVSDLRHRHKYFVVLIHTSNATKSLVQAANTSICYEEFVYNIPVAYSVKDGFSDVHLHVSNLPVTEDIVTIQMRLKQLSNNCGGKVLQINPPSAIIKFNNEDLLKRALKRLNGEDVLGSKILVQRKKSDLSVHSKHFTPRPGSCFKIDSNNHNHPKTGSGKKNKGPHKINAATPISKANGVQLTVTNIDSHLGAKLIQETIWNLITEYCPIWQLKIRPHNRFTVICDVTVPNVDFASCILQNLHRRKIGSKRILVSISQQAEDKSILNFRNSKLHQPYCQQHFQLCSKKSVGPVKIHLGLREFSAKLHTLLHSHDGCVYLDGFEHCYQAQFGSFPYPVGDAGGVYVEHEISYVPGVQIVHGYIKAVVWSQAHSDNGSDTASEASSTSRSKTANIVNISKELIDLLKNYSSCCLPYREFSSLYEQYYGHQLQIGGLCDLDDILLQVPHVIQVLGSSSEDRLITLTHRAQVKRFTQEIIKILKTAPDRAMLVAQLPDMYHKMFNRPWNLYDFGVNVLSDLLDDIPDGNICISGAGDNVVMSLPARERTLDEILRTTQFSYEVIEILKTQQRCRMSFTDFVPTYHRHFGRQCKLSNYGFNKLIDLFESLSTIVQTVEEGTEKYLQLTKEVQLKVLTSQILGLLRHQHLENIVDDMGIPLNRLQSLFSRKYGIALVPRYYNCCSIESLIGMLPHAVKLVKGMNGELFVKQSERKPIRLLCAQLLVLLLDVSIECVDLCQLHQLYWSRYNENITPNEYGFLSLADVVCKALCGVAKLEECDSTLLISLKPIYQRARRVRNILLENGGSMTLGEFNQEYRALYHESLDAERHGFRSCEAMLRALSAVLVVKGFGIKKMLVLRNHMQHGPLSFSLKSLSNSPSESNNGGSLNSIEKSYKFEDQKALTPEPESLLYRDNFSHKKEWVSTNLLANSPVAEAALVSGLFRPEVDNISRQPAMSQMDACLNTTIEPVISVLPSNATHSVSFSSNAVKAHRSFKATPTNAVDSKYYLCSYLEKSGVHIPRGACMSDPKACENNISHRRRVSLSVITMPNGTTSISSTSSPESFLSTDDDCKFSSDDKKVFDGSPSSVPHLAATFQASPFH
ncbi:meiosis regulator and mRNA stability factor 1-like isoform X2 [Clavelina lepadiformis]|uniref:meiosis regulator and mRNA stability factor 1-like isoform X2 n=1 Tax=Clavelina lepadiformis TaxID=159417 RepID=UPI0040417976